MKWAVLSTTSWDDMYKVLCDYAKEQNELDPKNGWDGNVVANYKTNDDPPKALGRWVNRQRTNYVKKRIKKEQIDKLNKLGLKWAVHDRSRYLSSCSTAVPNSVPSKPAVVSDSNNEKAAFNSDKGSSTNNSNAEASADGTPPAKASSSKPVVSDSSAAPKHLKVVNSDKGSSTNSANAKASTSKATASSSTPAKATSTKNAGASSEAPAQSVTMAKVNGNKTAAV